MQVTVILNTCNDCRHLDHSGSFTVRGARPICGHDDACVERVTKEQFLAEYPEYITTIDRKRVDSRFKYHWIHRVVTKNSKEKIKGIPKWCPVKHGSLY